VKWGNIELQCEMTSVSTVNQKELAMGTEVKALYAGGMTSCRSGHTHFGVKWQILPLCLKGKFYANHAFVHKGKILRHGCRCVHNDSILRHWIWRKIPLWRVMATFTKVTHT